MSQSTIKMEKGYYTNYTPVEPAVDYMSQSTIKMEKGYYCKTSTLKNCTTTSQSTIKMEKGYYKRVTWLSILSQKVAIHNKNGKGLLLGGNRRISLGRSSRNPQ